MRSYNHQNIEKKWQNYWETSNIFASTGGNTQQNHRYVLVEFPYPSGNLHVGHWYAFSVPDIYVRMLRMKGSQVLFPIGFDAFGLPAENAAIKHGINPAKWTYDNIQNMRRQLRTMGASFDWSHEVVTCDPSYYRWTQWLFLQFFQHGLAYQAEVPVNWCPSCKTVLANEQVNGGRCERCESEVDQRRMKQWLLKTTQYAERLLTGLEQLDWPPEIKEAQRNWIGKSEGINIDYEIESKLNYVILHGFEDSPDQHLYPWLQLELEQRGHSVIVPKLPGTDSPNIQEQVDYVLNTISFDERTVLIGRSLGAVVGLKALEKIGKPIHRVVLVAGFIEPIKKYPAPFDATCDWQFDFGKIRQNARDRIILHDIHDHIIPETHADRLAAGLEGTCIKVAAQSPHFAGLREREVLRSSLDQVTCFTTRPDTNFGATFIVAAPDSGFVREQKDFFPEKDHVDTYIVQAAKKTELERVSEGRQKTGVFTGIYARNPLNGRRLPIYVGDFVLAHVGTGAVIGVPGHDLRDFEFAQAMGIDIVRVVVGPDGDITQITQPEQVQEDAGTMVNSEFLDGMDIMAAKEKIMDVLVEKGWGRRMVQYKLRDWLVSRQRYWGCPIPVIYCRKCGENPKSEIRNPKQANNSLDQNSNQYLYTEIDGITHAVIPVPDNQLPVILPEIEDYMPHDDGQSPLAKAADWVRVTCPQCGGEARRETDTLDTFVDSSWYFLRYTDPHNTGAFAADENMRQWMPVDRYSGGAEHTTMHLLYSRFFIKAMHDLGLVPWDEPYVKRMNRGLIMGPDGQKMSKSRGNVIDPDRNVEEYGSDAVRMYLAFIGPYYEVGAYPWNPGGVAGIRKFLDKVWMTIVSSKFKIQNSKFEIPKDGTSLTRLAHQTIKKMTEDIEAFKFNTAISQLMVYTNELVKMQNQESGIRSQEVVQHSRLLVLLLAPFAPHITEELWERLGGHPSVSQQPWPSYDPELVRDEEIELVFQVNGKVRDRVTVAADISEADARTLALSSEKVRKYITGTAPRNVIVVKGKLVNVVV